MVDVPHNDHIIYGGLRWTYSGCLCYTGPAQDYPGHERHTSVSRKPPKGNTREWTALVELQAETLDLSLWGICFLFFVVVFRRQDTVEAQWWRASTSISSSLLSTGTPEEEAPIFFCCCLSIIIHAFSFDFEALCAWF